MKLFAFLIVCPLLVYAVPLSDLKPNIIVVLADDLGYAELGCYGSKTFKTPHIDALAEGGLRLTDFHSNGAVCSPTRAALLTGRYQQRSGIDGVVTAKSHRHTGLGLEQETVAELLKRAGVVHESMVNHVELAPTRLDFAGPPIPDDMQGYSLKPILEGRAEKVRDAAYYHFYSHGNNNPARNDRGAFSRAARNDRGALSRAALDGRGARSRWSVTRGTLL